MELLFGRISREHEYECIIRPTEVRTDPRKSWNFIVQNSRPLKVLESPGKSILMFV